ncbi:MAG: phage terminase large subunit [Rhodospirillales bacterium]|nr:phage terminase large subunit [Rhodospirillales bacterium]
METKKVEFGVFLALWNQLQGQDTPVIHFRMGQWLQQAWDRKKTRLLLQAFRSSGKSTIVGLFAAWLIYRQPDLRILVLAADLMLARKMVRNVKRIIERHPLTGALKPERADQWGADRFTVARDLELRDPSMLARGIGANMTGSRADIVICDDVEVPNTCDTAEKRADLRERLAEINYVLVPGGTQLYIGTPHSWYTIYAGQPRREIGEDKPFLDGFARLKIPVLENGNSSWEERFTAEDIERIRRSAGPNKFSSQMMLEPVNIAEGRLDPAAFRRYEADLDYLKEINLLSIGDRKMISASAWWDPAFGSARGDGSVLAVVYTDETGCYWLHRVSYLKSDPSAELDEAAQQCRMAARILKELLVPSVALEINGIGRFLPNILRRELALARVPCAVREITSTRPKDIRIIEAFDTVLAARMLHVHASVYATSFISEVQEWRPGAKGGHDDGLDAVAGALSLEPVRLKRYPGSGRQNWQGGSSVHEAKTDFEV